VSDGENTTRCDALEDASRRQFLTGIGGTLAAVGGGRAAYNTLLGYGELGMGTNLREQDLRAVVSERLRPRYDGRTGTLTLVVDEDALVVRVDENESERGDESETGDSENGTERTSDATYRLEFDRHDRADAARLDTNLGGGGRLLALFEDTAAIESGDYTFEFSQPGGFFERMAQTTARPDTVAALRGRWDRAVAPDVVESFADVSPRETEALVGGLVEGFREHTTYDVPRYLAGSIEDNVLFGTRDLRQYYEDDVDFRSLLEGERTGIFCWELVYRSIEAFHAVAPTAQTVPVAACYVSDHRHKHAFTGLVSAIREDGDLRLPMTFVDYTHTTMYDDFRMTGVLGEGLAAYNPSHRADDVYW
jgi:hypothetical protein